MRVSGALAGAGRFTVIPVEIDEVEEAGKGTKVTLRNPASSRPKATFASVFKASEDPLILQNADGSSYELAAQA